MNLTLSKRANDLLEKYQKNEIKSYDIHLEDAKFLEAQYFLKILDNKISELSYIKGDNLELDALMLSTLEMTKKVGPHYLLLANFREIENYLRDDITKLAWASIGAQKENWENSLFILIRSLVYCLLLKSGLEFHSIPETYMAKVDLLQKQFEVINLALSQYSFSTFELVSLEENELYVNVLNKNQKLPDQITLALCDGVCEYLTLCYGQSYIKLVASRT